jgi:hypothetical protein
MRIDGIAASPPRGLHVASRALGVSGLHLLSTAVEVGVAAFAVALGGDGVVPVFGWASWP